ncbi:hypothetical protein V1L54_09940 [Streptomyces sp. TRM 70361]|nr:hypothetical protein [Streptomyces sp. TRM 70361]MEE1939724.1 hypothetical protein [Streptomyces sp. TRM 70361]
MLVRISQHSNGKARLVTEVVVTAPQGEGALEASRHREKAMEQARNHPA